MAELWLICLAVATPIAGVVGFAVQLRTVRKVQLESAKLELEIRRLQSEIEKTERRVIPASDEEIERYSDIRFSLRVRSPCPGPDDDLDSRFSRTSPVLAAVGLYAALAGVILFVLYLGYDIYRLGAWLWTLL